MSTFDDVESCSPPSKIDARGSIVFRLLGVMAAGRWRHAVAPLITAVDAILSS